MGGKDPVKSLEDAAKGALNEVEDTVARPFRETDKFLKNAYNKLTGKGQQQGQPEEGVGPEAPSLEDATIVAQNRLQEDAKKRRASQTLFTGGQGVLDQPSTASSVLLGM